MKPTKYKAVFFDLDGTLVDIREPLFESARLAFKQIGLDPALSRERYEALLNEHGLWLGVPEKLRRDYIRIALPHFMAHAEERALVPLPGVSDTLTEIKRRGYTTGVVTSRPGDTEKLSAQLAEVGLRAFLDHVLTAPTNSLKALDKTESLRHAASLAGVAAKECVYVGDEPRDVAAASAAGYGARIAVATGAAGFDHLRLHPEFKPDYVLGTMGELIATIERLESDAIRSNVE